MITLGITGGIGCGKTTICKTLSLLDIPLFISDIEAKKLMTNNPIVRSKLIAILGEDCYLKNGGLNMNTEYGIGVGLVIALIAFSLFKLSIRKKFKTQKVKI